MKRISVLCFIISCSQPGLAQQSFATVDAILTTNASADAPGMSIGIMEQGKLVYHQQRGMANMEYNIPLSDSSVFGIASLSKQFTAACAWVLINKGQLGPDDDIRKYLPELPDYGYTIRIRHLLNHTSGIRNYHTLMDLAGFDYDKEYYTNADILALACRQQKLNNKPGEKVLYGNTGYTLLAIIIERIAGENLNSFAQKNLFQPLGMTHTLYVTDTTSIIPNRAYGYGAQNGAYIQFPRNQVTYGAGSMASTIKDLAIWSTVLTQDKPEYTALARFLSSRDTLPSGEIAGYARGLMVDRFNGYQTIHHSGFSAGGQTWMITVPELHTSVIILTNNANINPEPISNQILEELIPEAVARSATRPSKPNYAIIKAADYQRYANTYIELNSDMRMDIIQNGDSLYARGAQGRQDIAIIPQPDGSFSRRNNESVRYHFYKPKRYEYDLTISFGGTPFYFRKAMFVPPESVQLADYTGTFYSAELQTTYVFTAKENKLILMHPSQGKQELHPTLKDAFGNGARVSYQFLRDKSGRVNAMQLAAEGTVKDIHFIKQ